MTKAEWNKKYGFNENDTTFIYYLDNSYSVKDELKEAGFIFAKELLWHAASIPQGYEDKVIEIPFSLVGEYMAWGDGIFKPEVKTIIKDMLAPYKTQTIKHTGTYVFEEKERVRDYPCRLEQIRVITTKYGDTQLVTFVDDNDNLFCWWTSVLIEVEEGSNVIIDFTLKTHNEYNGELQNVVTRVKIH